MIPIRDFCLKDCWLLNSLYCVLYLFSCMKVSYVLIYSSESTEINSAFSWISQVVMRRFLNFFPSSFCFTTNKFSNELDCGRFEVLIVSYGLLTSISLNIGILAVVLRRLSLTLDEKIVGLLFEVIVNTFLCLLKFVILSVLLDILCPFG